MIIKNTVKGDAVNHPVHYTQGIEVIDYIESHKLDFNEGNVIKYLTRYKYKNGIEDLKKAQWYLNRLVEQNVNEYNKNRLGGK